MYEHSFPVSFLPYATNIASLLVYWLFLNTQNRICLLWLTGRYNFLLVNCKSPLPHFTQFNVHCRCRGSLRSSVRMRSILPGIRFLYFSWDLRKAKGAAGTRSPPLTQQEEGKVNCSLTVAMAGQTHFLPTYLHL